MTPDEGRKPPILVRNVLRAIAFLAITLLGLIPLGLCPTLLLADVVLSLTPATPNGDLIENGIAVAFVLILSGFLVYHAIRIARGE